MTPELINNINLVISGELMLSLMELNEMNHCHEMGLQGYKRFHRYWAMDRQRHAIMLSNFVVEYHHIVPQIAVDYNSESSPTSPTLLDALTKMYNMSKTQLDTIKKCAKMAIDEGEDLLMGMLESMLKDESLECERYYREILEISFVKSDPGFIACHSEKLHCKYKEKEKEYFGYKDPKYGGV
jgi:ferritin